MFAEFFRRIAFQRMNWFARRGRALRMRKRARLSFFRFEDRITPAPFATGNLVIDRVGNGSSALSSAGTQVSLIELTTAGAAPSSGPNVVNMPTFGAANQGGFVDSGTATSNGHLNLSADGRFLTLLGIDAPLGTAGVAGTSATANNRNVARVDAAGNIAIRARLADTYSTSNPRSAVTESGDVFYTGGTGSTGTDGVRYVNSTSSVATTSTQLFLGNLRDIVIATDSLGNRFLFDSAQTSINAISGTPFPTSATSHTTIGVTLTDAGGFVFFDRAPGVGATDLGGLDTLYVSDGSGGLKKFEWSGSAWAARGSTTGTSLFGLTGRIAPDGSVELYATSAIASNNGLYRFVDSTNSNAFGGTISGSLTLLASAGSNFAFRGIAFTPQTTVSTLTAVGPVSTSATYTATFGVAVAGLTASNFSLSTTGGVAGTIGTPTTSDNVTWTIPVTGITGNGTLTLNMANSTGLTPGVNNTPFAGSTLTVTNAGNVAPVLTTNALTISEGGTVVLSSANINTTDPDNTAAQLTYTVTGLSHGQFELVANPGVAITSFTQLQIDSGAVQFVHDGGEVAPSYSLTVGDGSLSDGPHAAAIIFTNVNDQPVLAANALTISEGGTVVLSSANANTTDPDNTAAQLTYTVTGLSHGQFELVANPGVAITSFTQLQIDSGAVQFVHDGGEVAPSYSLTVSDGSLSDGPHAAAITFTNVNDAPVVTAPASVTTVTNTPFVFAGANAVFISDVDVGAGNLIVRLMSTHGTLTMTTLTGLAFSRGDGAGDSRMEFSGSLANINSALATLFFSPDLNYDGPAAITVAVNDLGFSGSGGALFGFANIAVTVMASNHAPSFTLGSNQEFTIQQDDSDLFANPWPGTQTVSHWATNLSAGLGEFIIDVGVPDATHQFVSFEIEVLSNPGLFVGTPTVSLNAGNPLDLSTADLAFTPNPQHFGTAILRVRMHDSGGTDNGGVDTSPWQTFTITIAPQYQSPQPKVRYLGPKTDIAMGGSSTAPAVAMNPASGNFAAVWAAADASNVYFQRFLADGTPQGSPTPVNAPGGTHTKPAIGIDAAGDFVVAWEFNTTDILVRQYTAVGIPSGAAFIANNTLAGDQQNPAIAVNLDGSFLVAWSGPDGAGNGIFARRFTSGGVAIDPTDLAVNSNIAGTQTNPSVALDAAGDFVVAWQGPDGDGSGVLARRYDAALAAFGVEFPVNTTTAGNDSAVTAGMDSVGDIVIGWINFDGADSRARFQQYDAAGAAFGVERTIATIAGRISTGFLTMDGDGDFVLVWDTGAGVDGQRYRVNGVLDDAYHMSAAGEVEYPRVGSSADGDFVVVWQRNVASEGRIDLQQYSYNQAPYDVTYAGDTQIDESSDAAGNAAISGTFTAHDRNPDDTTFVYSVQADDSGGGFGVNPSSGALFVADASKIDFESAPVVGGDHKAYSITVRAADPHGLFHDATISVTIDDVNETPTAIHLNGNSPAAPVPEHSPLGTVVGTLSTDDPDANDNSVGVVGNPTFSAHSYTLVNSAGGRFALVGNEIRVADVNALEEHAPPASVDGMGNHYYEITVRATDGGMLSRDEVIRVYLAPVAETVVSNVRIGDETATRHQRSRIDKLTVTFSRVIDLVNPNTDVAAAFSLSRLEDSSTVNLTFSWSVNNNGTPGDPSDDFSVVDITFAAQANVFGRSLNDGNYELHIDGSQLRDIRGVQVDGNNDGAAGGAQNVRFYRFFGDFLTTGNYHEDPEPVSWRQVDGLDLAAFRIRYGTIDSGSNYDPAFDYDGDGDVDGFDLAQFRFRYGRRLNEIP